MLVNPENTQVSRRVPGIMLLLLLSRFSCVRLCDPKDDSPPGSAVPGILQARTLEWVAISFSSAWKWKWSHSVVSDSVRPHGLQPTRLLCPWDFPGIMLGTGNSEIITCFLFGHLLHLVNSSNCFSLWIFPPIFFASAVIHSIITTCVSHCNYQLVPKLFFGIYVSAKLIIVLRYGTVWGFQVAQW